MIHSVQFEFFLPNFPYSELLIWMLPAPNVTDHSYFDKVYLKIFTALSKQKEDFCLLPMYCRLFLSTLEDFYFCLCFIRFVFVVRTCFSGEPKQN